MFLIEIDFYHSPFSLQFFWTIFLESLPWPLQVSSLILFYYWCCIFKCVFAQIYTKTQPAETVLVVIVRVCMNLEPTTLPCETIRELITERGQFSFFLQSLTATPCTLTPFRITCPWYCWCYGFAHADISRTGYSTAQLLVLWLLQSSCLFHNVPWATDAEAVM